MVNNIFKVRSRKPNFPNKATKRDTNKWPNESLNKLTYTFPIPTSYHPINNI